MEDQNFNETELEKYFSDLELRRIEVPEKLGTYLEQRLEKAAKRKQQMRLMTAACIILLLLSLPGVMLTPKLSVYAQNIPILKIAVKWLYGDTGLREAAAHGYFVQEPVEIEKDGIKVQIKDFSLDEERMSFTAIASGPRIDEVRAKNIYAFMEIEFPELEKYSKENQTRMLTGETRKGISQYTATQQLVFGEGMVKQFIKDKNPKSIEADVTVRLSKPYRPEAGEKPSPPERISLGKLYIPFDSGKLLESKRINITGQFKTEHMKVSINSLTVSPTRMRMLLNAEMADGVELEGLYNPAIIDNKGNTYKYDKSDFNEQWDIQNGYYVLGGNKLGDKTWELPFIPSLYFREPPKEMYLVYDGYFISAHRGKDVSLTLNGKYPVIHKYMGKDIIIKEAYFKKGVLNLKALVPREFYSLEIADKDSKYSKEYNNRTFIDYENDKQLVEYEIDTEQRTKYNLEFIRPLYHVKEEGKVKIEICK